MLDGFRRGRLLRVFVGEGDRHGAQPLYTAIVELLRKRGIAGATVFRGIEGYGGRGQIHVAKVFSMPDLPVVIEAVDDAGKLEALVPEIRAMLRDGLMTLEFAEFLQIGTP